MKIEYTYRQQAPIHKVDLTTGSGDCVEIDLNSDYELRITTDDCCTFRLDRDELEKFLEMLHKCHNQMI